MKQKHRKNLYYAIAILVVILTLPIWILGYVICWLVERLVDASDILKYLLKVYDEDPKTDNQ